MSILCIAPVSAFSPLSPCEGWDKQKLGLCLTSLSLPLPPHWRAGVPVLTLGGAHYLLCPGCWQPMLHHCLLMTESWLLTNRQIQTFSRNLSCSGQTRHILDQFILWSSVSSRVCSPTEWVCCKIVNLFNTEVNTANTEAIPLAGLKWSKRSPTGLKTSCSPLPFPSSSAFRPFKILVLMIFSSCKRVIHISKTGFADFQQKVSERHFSKKNIQMIPPDLNSIGWLMLYKKDCSSLQIHSALPVLQHLGVVHTHSE